jgi:hypothetical protein
LLVAELGAAAGEAEEDGEVVDDEAPGLCGLEGGVGALFCRAGERGEEAAVVDVGVVCSDSAASSSAELLSLRASWSDRRLFLLLPLLLLAPFIKDEGDNPRSPVFFIFPSCDCDLISK